MKNAADKKASKSIDAKKINSPCKKTSSELTIALYLAARHVSYSRSGTILCVPPWSVIWALHKAVHKLEEEVHKFEEELLSGEEWQYIAHELTIALYLAARHVSYSQVYGRGMTPPLEVMMALEDAVFSFEKNILPALGAKQK